MPTRSIVIHAVSPAGQKAVKRTRPCARVSPGDGSALRRPMRYPTVDTLGRIPRSTATLPIREAAPDDNERIVQRRLLSLAISERKIGAVDNKHILRQPLRNLRVVARYEFGEGL